MAARSWPACSGRTRAPTYEPYGNNDPFSGCRTSTGIQLEVDYGRAPEVRGQTRQIGGKVAAVHSVGDRCALEWNQGESGAGNTWFAAVMFTLRAADCDTAARLAEQAIRLAGQEPGDAAATPQRPLLYPPDEPDTAQAGACADFFVANGQDDCQPYDPVPVPRGTEKIMAAADADRAVQCAVFANSVTAIFGPAFRALTWRDHCFFVEPTHTVKIRVNVTPNFPPAAYGLPPNRWPDRRETEIAGKAALTFWHENRSGFDVYLSPYNDLNRSGHVHIQVEARPARGDGSGATARLDPATAEMAIKVIAQVTAKHFAS